MKRRLNLIIFAMIAVTVFCSETLAFGPGDISPADAYSNPDDYELILMDEDGWELRMRQKSDRFDRTIYSGVLYYSYNSKPEPCVGKLSAVFLKSEEILLITCIDSCSWNKDTISYTFHFDQYSDWRMRGGYLYFDRVKGNDIWADIVKGQLAGHEPSQ